MSTPMSILAAAAGGEVDGGFGDTHYNYVNLLLSGNGSDGGGNETFDVSGSTVANKLGLLGQGSFTPYFEPGNTLSTTSGRLGNWSYYFNTQDSNLHYPSNASFNFGTNNFCVEFWFYTTKFIPDTYDVLVKRSASGSWSNGWTIYLSSSNRVGEWGTGFLSSTNAYDPNQWNHVVFCRTGGTTSLFVNGVRVGTTTSTYNFGTAYPIYIGSDNGSNYFLQGMISNLRIEQNGSSYSATSTTLTVPKSPLTITSSTIYLSLGSPFPLDLTGKALYVDSKNSIVPLSPFKTATLYDPASHGGSLNLYSLPFTGYHTFGDSLEITHNSTNLNFGTGNSTVDFWFYHNLAPGDSGAIVGKGSTNTGWAIFLDSSWRIVYRYLTIDQTVTSSYVGGLGNGGLVAPRCWYHLAVTRLSGTLYIHVNGTLVTSFFEGNNITTSNNLLIGRAKEFPASTTIKNFRGYITDLRLCPQALYSSSSFVSTLPLTPRSEVSPGVFLGFRKGAITDSVAKNSLLTQGQVRLSIAEKKYGPSSIFFNGYNSRLIVGVNQHTSLYQNNFTVEMWVYPLTVSGAVSNLIQRNPISTPFEYALFINGGNYVYFLSSGTNPNNVWDLAANVSFGSADANQWTHIAFVKNGSVFSAYKNGVLGNSTTTSSNMVDSINGMYLGYNVQYGFPFHGYMDDVRVTRGVARYTSNFTPPAIQNPGAITTSGGTESSLINFADVSNGAYVGNSPPNTGSTDDNFIAPSPYSYSVAVPGSYNAIQLLNCNGSQVNNFARPSKPSSYTTLFNGAGSSTNHFVIMLNLGQVRSFDSMYVYQSFTGNGKVTHFRFWAFTDLSLNPTSCPTRYTGNINLVTDWVGVGNTGASFDGVWRGARCTAQYIRFDLYNAGTYGFSSYTEIYALKIFGE